LIATASIIIAAAYLVGAIPFGLVFSRLFTGKDPRRHGSGNIGATNAMRTGGKAVGILTLAADLLKGAIPVGLSIHWQVSEWLTAGIALAAFIGHCFPVYLAFRGGKGVATMFGVVLPWQPWIAVLAFAMWLASLRIWRYVSVSSMLAAGCMPLLAWALGSHPAFITTVAALGVLTVIRHRANIVRLFRHEEPKVGKRDDHRLRAS
jgi:acyl phosphate:glycerol-3-phosphate acyltransferase